MLISYFYYGDYMQRKLKAKEEEILSFIKEYIEKNNFPPTVREIGQKVNLSSPASVYAHLKKLEELKLIEHTSKKFRSIKLINEKKDMNKIPLIIDYKKDDYLNIKEYITLSFIKEVHKCYAIKVKKDIYLFKKDDYLIIEDVNSYKEKDYILYLENDNIILNKYNDKIKKEDIIGKVICSLKIFN